MGVRVEWFDAQQTVIYQVIDEPFEWDAFHEQDKIVKMMIASVAHPVSLLVDVRAFSMRNAPTGILTHVRTTIPGMPQNLKRIVVVGDNSFAQALINMIQRIGLFGSSRQIQMVRSLADAQAYLGLAQS